MSHSCKSCKSCSALTLSASPLIEKHTLYIGVRRQICCSYQRSLDQNYSCKPEGEADSGPCPTGLRSLARLSPTLVHSQPLPVVFHLLSRSLVLSPIPRASNSEVSTYGNPGYRATRFENRFSSLIRNLVGNSIES